MKTTRLSPLLIAVIGGVLSLIAVAVVIFALIRPLADKTTAMQARLDAAAPGPDWDSRQQGLQVAQRKGQKDVKDAKVQVQQIQMRWAQQSAALMPRYDVSDRYKAMSQLTYELTHYLAPDLQRQLTVGGVKSNTVIAMPPPPVGPNAITAGPVVIPLGTIGVNGDFRHILTHFYDWQYFNRLVLPDGLALNGNSPYMQGTYTGTLYIFPQNDDKLPPPDPKAGAGGTSAGGGGGGFGGYPGGGGSPYPGGGSPYPGGR